MVLRGLRRLSGRFFINPLTRTAMVTFLWAHRHEVLRWGRSLWEHLARRDLDPAAAVRTAKVLFAIAGDERFRDAKQLRRVTMIDGIVNLEADEWWSLLPSLVLRVRSVDGVREVLVNGVRNGGPILPAQEAASAPAPAR